MLRHRILSKVAAESRDVRNRQVGPLGQVPSGRIVRSPAAWCYRAK